MGVACAGVSQSNFSKKKFLVAPDPHWQLLKQYSELFIDKVVSVNTPNIYILHRSQQSNEIQGIIVEVF